MIRNPQILGSRARAWRSTVLVALPLTLSQAACGLKGPLYLPGPATTATSTAAPAPASTPASAPTATPSTPNTPAR